MYKVTDQYLQKYANSACKSKEWDSLPFQEFVKVFMGENTAEYGWKFNKVLVSRARKENIYCWFYMLAL